MTPRSRTVLAALTSLLLIATWVMWPEDEQDMPTGGDLEEPVVAAADGSSDEQLHPASTEPEATEDDLGTADQAAVHAEPETTEVAERVDAGPVPTPGTVLIQVVDSVGNAVPGIQVAIGMQVPFEKRAVRVGSGTSAGERGIAAVKLNMEYLRRNAGMMQNPELMADPKFPTSEKARVKFLLEDGQNEVQKLVVPDFQWLNAEVRRADGSRPDFPVSLQIYWGPLQTADNKSPWSNRRSIWQDLENGSGRFPCGPDLQLWLTAKAKDGRCKPADLRTIGPAAGQPATDTYELVLGDDYPVFRSQFLAADGSPAANARIAHYSLQQRIPTAEEAAAGNYPGPDRPRWEKNFTTDAQGWGGFPLSKPLSDDKYERSWAFVLQNPDPRRSSKQIDEDGAEQVRISLPNQLNAGEVFNPGPLTLHSKKLPVLAAGKIVDANGNPLSIWVTVYGPDEKGSMRNRLARERTNRDGNFEILGEAPQGGQIHVSTGGSGWLGEGQNVAAGTSNLLFELEKGINLHGSFKSDAPLPWLDMEVKLPSYHRGKEVFGSFMFDYLKPGTGYYITLEHNDRELYRGPEFSLSGSGDQSPDFLNPIDLTGKLRVWKTIPLQADGTPFPVKTYFYFSAGDGGANRVRTNKLHQLVQVTSSDVNSVTIIPRDGYLPGELTWPNLAEKLQLETE